MYIYMQKILKRVTCCLLTLVIFLLGLRQLRCSRWSCVILIQHVVFHLALFGHLHVCHSTFFTSSFRQSLYISLFSFFSISFIYFRVGVIYFFSSLFCSLFGMCAVLHICILHFCQRCFLCLFFFFGVTVS